MSKEDARRVLFDNDLMRQCRTSVQYKYEDVLLLISDFRVMEKDHHDLFSAPASAPALSFLLEPDQLAQGPGKIPPPVVEPWKVTPTSPMGQNASSGPAPVATTKISHVVPAVETANAQLAPSV
ncbi:MAG: hypothetical protein M1827_003743 [Pycnora praestabilis]|nr:MAG: hypothetical protein M1827_003743 [Pycnora praestabilis]